MAAAATAKKTVKKPDPKAKAEKVSDRPTHVALEVRLTTDEAAVLRNVLDRVVGMLDRNVMTVASGNEEPMQALAKVLDALK